MTVRMNPEIKALWVAWLRDPAHIQGLSYLRREDNTFCCLGGLCEIAKQAGIVVARLGTGSGHFMYCPPDDPDTAHAGMLPDVVQHWAGVTRDDPIVMWRGDKATLTELNDIKKLTFEQIATVIEEQL